MKKLSKNLFFAIIMAGLFAGCESGDPLVNKASDALKDRDYQGVLTATNEALELNPNNIPALYYNATAHSEIARQIPEPVNRKSDYRSTREKVERIYSIADTLAEKPAEVELATQMSLNTWAYEHNSAINIVTSDSIMNADPNALPRAIAHLENAIIVNPDSIQSYAILSQVYYMDNNVSAAIEALEASMDMQNPPVAQDYNRLATFYTFEKDTENTLRVLEEGLEIYPDSVFLVQKIADAYSSTGQVERAVNVIQGLIETDPQNAQYRLALGTQLYKSTDNWSIEFSENLEKIYDLNREARSQRGDKKAETQKQISELEARNEVLMKDIEEYTNRAVNELVKVTELDPENVTAYRILGIIHGNNAKTYYDLRNFTMDNEKASKYGEQAKEELKKSVDYYEKQVAIDPSDTDTWRALSRAYVTLDMPEKAEAAMDKAGM